MRKDAQFQRKSARQALVTTDHELSISNLIAGNVFPRLVIIASIRPSVHRLPPLLPIPIPLGHVFDT
jgi:hypothetical protein